jgi:hypothetical protein
MSQMFNLDMTREQVSQLQAMMEECSATIRAAEQRMEQRAERRKRLHAETEVMLRQLKEMLHVENNL